MPARYLPIYVNDHLFGVVGGVELCRRTMRENESSELGVFLGSLLTSLEEDRDSLLRLLRTLGIAPSRAKTAAAWTVEKLGRLKLNGELTRYSPLSRLLELEGLASGIAAKEALWLALRQVQDCDERLAAFPLDELAARARAQREQLEPHLHEAARAALG